MAKSAQTASSEATLRRRRLGQAAACPELVLENGWFQDPVFCRAFFDRCEDEALHISPESLELAHRAVQVAETHGDPCMAHHAHGVLSHAYLARADRFWAGKTLETYRQAAIDCCPLCRSRFLCRDGDLLAELKKASDSLLALNRCLEEGRGLLSDDDLARIYYVRGVAYHFAGQRERAIEDAGQTLRLLSLESPKGFFSDTLALLVIYIGGGDLDDDAAALNHIVGFKQRIHGGRWKDVLTRAYWAEGHCAARLGDVTLADRKLGSAQIRLIDGGLKREAMAVTIDRAQLKCRPTDLREDSLRNAGLDISRCLRLRSDLTDDDRQCFKAVQGLLVDEPEIAFRELVDLRRSFIAPVPGQLGERIGPE